MVRQLDRYKEKSWIHAFVILTPSKKIIYKNIYKNININICIHRTCRSAVEGTKVLEENKGEKLVKRILNQKGLSNNDTKRVTKANIDVWLCKNVLQNFYMARFHKGSQNQKQIGKKLWSTVLTIPSIQVCSIKYMHTALRTSPPSIPRILFILPNRLCSH